MNDFSKIEAVLFDMDGTLIEHTWQLSQLTGAMFKQFQANLTPLTEAEFYDVFWPKNADMWSMMVDELIDGDTAQLYSYVNTLRTLKKDTALAAEMLAYWTELVLAEAVPFQDTTSVLKALRPHFTTGIITNGFTSFQWAKIRHYELDQAVDFCLVSEEAGTHKPDPRIFELALEKAGGLSPRQAIFIGDTLASDIEGALRAGLEPIFMNPRDDQTPPPGVPKIKTLAEFLALLGRPEISI